MSIIFRCPYQNWYRFNIIIAVTVIAIYHANKDHIVYFNLFSDYKKKKTWIFSTDLLCSIYISFGPDICYNYKLSNSIASNFFFANESRIIVCKGNDLKMVFYMKYIHCPDFTERVMYGANDNDLQKTTTSASHRMEKRFQ
ncbi:hypothetical protein BD770DRAFT_411896 [Pilaira anomala]|nr:hypothetical protein BD770DRAFT_411896 [Pilaira anomala]